jgi:hypothetical protein
MGVLPGSDPKADGKIEGENHAERHRLSVQQRVAEPGLGFEGMAEGVAEIQQSPIPLLALIGGDDGPLHSAAGQNGVCRRGWLQIAHGRAVALQPFKKNRIADQPVFDDLGITGAQFTRRQGCERAGVRKHQARLVEGAEQVFAGARIDRRLAAHRAVDLSQQGCRDLDEIDAAQQRRRGKSRDIADHPAAQRDQHRPALDAASEDLIDEAAEMGEILGRLA